VDLLTFIVRIVEALAWPVAAGLIFWALRSHVGELLERIERFKWKDTEVSFGAEIDKVEVKFGGSEAGTLLEDVLVEVDKATRDFGTDGWRLFDAIARREKSVEVAVVTREVFEVEFTRDSKVHEVFWKVRNASLIRPDEGGQWRPDKHAVATTLGRFIRRKREGRVAA
jgi:hypothetical protein